MKYRLLIEYDGAGFNGWQRQPGVPTVQEALETALATALRTPTAVVGSGRTDAGVHARGQVAHFETEEALDPHRLRGALHGLLPATIAVHEVLPAPDSFHARYDATARCYHYYVATGPVALERGFRVPLYPAPDFRRMNAAASALLGTHDFDAFCRTQSETINRICTVEEAAWHEESLPGAWHFRIVANRFLHGMVRAIVGTLLEIGRGKREERAIHGILASRDRRAAGPAAAARGLVLEAVRYSPPS